MTPSDPDVIVIGAGPAGAAAAATLAGQDWRVHVFERGHFPRFSLGESLLPRCMVDLEAAGLLDAVLAGGYQPKNGAAFTRDGRETAIDFRDKSTPGWGTTFQVERADFDRRLIEAAAERGAAVTFGASVEAFHADPVRPRVSVCYADGHRETLETGFVLDASGAGRVLARLEQLECESGQAARSALFTHVDVDEATLARDGFDREKILIGVHPDDAGLWYWLIPLADGRASVGVVGDRARMATFGETPAARFAALIAAEPRFRALLEGAPHRREVGELQGYSTDVTRLHGPGYALLGNAGAFLDPVFSSGVTLALRSASLAAPLVARQLAGETVAWDDAFDAPLRRGMATFRAFVDGWYDGRLQSIVFHENAPPSIQSRISAILAGYAWDDDNPFTRETAKHLDTLAALCGHERAGPGTVTA
ncbi:NAD(P)/FAD-dependent oxidoreductase [Salinicola aestuarinus]|uniref:NAD(P)/FAD-dependent oxidoreductase n=1 Tax=Salinicola aestuarinus TaxID=1949082 RepID=UPI000DA19208|nr:tryptophan 7-halogenase [Salinicola aestuarinus]